VLVQLREAGVKRARHESTRLSALIQQSANELGVQQHSDMMEDVLSAVNGMTAGDNGLTAMEHQIKAARVMQRYWRGCHGRKRAAFVKTTKIQKAARVARAARMVTKSSVATAANAHREKEQAQRDGKSSPRAAAVAVGFNIASKLRMSSVRAQANVKEGTYGVRAEAGGDEEYRARVASQAAKIRDQIALSTAAVGKTKVDPLTASPSDLKTQSRIQKVDKDLETLSPKAVIERADERVRERERESERLLRMETVMEEQGKSLQAIQEALAALTMHVSGRPKPSYGRPKVRKPSLP
jgi:hypothetical protein